MAPDNRHDDRLYHALLVLLAIGRVWLFCNDTELNEINIL
jgi:hypothetical protein